MLISQILNLLQQLMDRSANVRNNTFSYCFIDSLSLVFGPFIFNNVCQIYQKRLWIDNGLYVPCRENP